VPLVVSSSRRVHSDATKLNWTNTVWFTTNWPMHEQVTLLCASRKLCKFYVAQRVCIKTHYRDNTMYVYVLSRFTVYYASVTKHNTLYIVLKRTYFMLFCSTLCFVWDVRVINRRKTRFSRYDSLEWRHGWL